MNVGDMKLNVPLVVMKSKVKRSARALAASSPLLRRAGLEPHIQRTFTADSADTPPEECPTPPQASVHQSFFIIIYYYYYYYQ